MVRIFKNIQKYTGMQFQIQLPTIRKVAGDLAQKNNIIVKFTNRKIKDEVLRQRQVAEMSILLQKTADLAKSARELCRENKVAATWTSNFV